MAELTMACFTKTFLYPEFFDDVVGCLFVFYFAQTMVNTHDQAPPRNIKWLFGIYGFF